MRIKANVNVVSTVKKGRHRRNQSNVHLPDQVVEQMKSASSVYNPMVAQSVSMKENPDFLKAVSAVKNQYEMNRRTVTCMDQSQFMRGSEITARGSEMMRASEVEGQMGGEAVIESESFAVFSNVDFLMMVGKICS